MPAARTTPRSVPEALRSLRRRADVRAASRVAIRTGIRVRAVGGCVRDAFLGRTGGDLDLSVPAEAGERFATALAEELGVRAVAIGAEGRRIWRVVSHGREADVWPEEGDVESDALRRDFTVNALSFTLPGGAFHAPPSALTDLAARRLSPPRGGVFLEDPLRVLRAARLAIDLPGFRVDPRALPEIRQAARRLDRVAPERRLAELDLVLAAHPRKAARALRDLESWGALEAMSPGTTSGERCRGIARVRRAPSADAGVARALLVEPLGASRALGLLASWKVTRHDLQLARALLASPRGRGGTPTRHEVVAETRRLGRFARQGALFLAAHPSRRALGAAVGELAARPRELARVLAPARPFSVAEIVAITGQAEGPRLGAILRELDTELASGAVRGRRAARSLLRRLAASSSARRGDVTSVD